MINIYQRLNTNQQDLIKLCQEKKIIELALFGSILRDDFNSESDIDLLVTFAEDAKITFFDLDSIENQFSRLFNRPVDVVTKKAINNSHNPIRKKNILDNVKVIYKHKSGNLL